MLKIPEIKKPGLSLILPSRSNTSTPTTSTSSNYYESTPQSFMSSNKLDGIPLKKLINLTELELMQFDIDSSKEGLIIFKGIYNGIPCYLKIFSNRCNDFFDGLIYECKIYNLIKKLQVHDDLAKKYFIPVLDIIMINNKEELFKLLFSKKYDDITLNDNMYFYHGRELFNLEDDIFAIITEDIRGTNLQTICEEKQLDKKHLVSLFKGLFYIHEIGIMHNDLHFENILYNPVTGELCFFDFDRSYHKDFGINESCENLDLAFSCTSKMNDYHKIFEELLKYHKNYPELFQKIILILKKIKEERNLSVETIKELEQIGGKRYK